MTRAVVIGAALVGMSAMAPHLVQGPPAQEPGTESYRGHAVAAEEVLVAFRQPPDVGRVSADVGADEVVPVGAGSLLRVHARGKDVHALIAQLSARRDVAFVEPNYILYAIGEPNDPRFPELWGLRNTGQVVGGVTGTPGADVSAVAAWDTATGSRTAVVGVVDTGIDYSHPDLAPNVWSAPSRFSVTIGGFTYTCGAGTHGFNAITRTCDPFDDHGHGTHVSGTIGAVGNNGAGVAGINWIASVMGLKFLSASGSGTTSDAINAIEFAVQAKAAFPSGAANVRVLSNSWAGAPFSQGLLNEINRANQSEMLFVAAAGNSGTNNDATPVYPASYSAPNIVAVAATNNQDGLASFSNYGSSSVHLGAPGVQVLSTIPGAAYTYFSGTSMATPHVSGAAALILSRCAASTATLKSLILDNVDRIPSLAAKTVTGGRLNVARAVEACGPPGNSAPAIALTAPTAEAYSLPSSITLAATAIDAGGSVAQVAFYAGTALVGVDTTAPYEIVWSDATVGNYAITAVATDNAGATATTAPVTIHVLPGPSSLPFGGAATALPGIVEAENFNEGGEGIAYHDLTAGNSGGSYRQTGVDIETASDTGGGYSLGYVEPGEWVAYWVNVSVTTAYTLDARIASLGQGGSFHIEMDGVDVTGRMTVPNTGGWHTWQTISFAGIPLTSGAHLMRVVFDTKGPNGWFGNLNYLRWSAPGVNAPPSVQLTSPAAGATFTAPANIALAASAADADGSVTQVAFYAGSTLVGTDATSPYAASWSNVPAGTYGLTAVATDNTGATTTSGVVTIQVVPPPKPVPFGGTATAIPGTIEAENFDDGGEGVAYHDTTAGNSGGKYRQTDVDIESTTDVGGGYSLGYVAAGEWLKYSVSVATAGTYTVETRLASIGAGGVFHIEVDDVNVTGSLGVPDTSGWQSWRSVLLAGIPLTAGPHVLRFVIDSNGASGWFGNVNWMRWTASTANAVPSVQLTSPLDGTTYTRPATVTLTAAVSDTDGTVAQVAFYAGSSLIGIDTAAPFSLTWSFVPAGDYTITARAIDDGGAAATSTAVAIHVVVPTAPTPFGGTPAAVPGVVQAENFDEGGEGLAYHDSTAGNSGGQYRQTDVDIEAAFDTGGGYSIGYVTAGEWLGYSISVGASGSYTLQARVASAAGNGTFHVDIDGVNVTGTLAIPNTGGWQTWQTITQIGVPLTAGPHFMRIVFDAAGSSGYVGNLNFVQWIAE